MKISNKLPSATQGTASSADIADINKKGKASGPKTAFPAGDSAKVDLSPRAQELRKAKELATPSDSIDEAKVARLQKLIDAGQYKVDADAIADRLLDEQMKMPT